MVVIRMLLRVGLIMLIAGGAGAQMDVSVTVDFGQDLGQNLGTLFEARDGEGRLVGGAGFASVYNTHYRGERYKVQFFLRPPAATDAYTIERLPAVTTDSGEYAYDLGDAVYARGNGKTYGTVRRWDPAAAGWQDVPPEANPGQYCATVRGKTLAWSGNRILYDGKVILDQPERGRYISVYYGQGHLFCYYYTDPADEAPNELRAFPWTPYATDLKVDVSRAVTVKLSFKEEFPYAWGQFGNQVLNCSNWGGLYVFADGAWSRANEPKRGVSYQVYSMINYHDKLYLAQYPTGRLLCWDGETVTELPDWPPVPEGASPSAREAQTTMLYRGELLVGVWPWAELWRHDPDTQSWRFMQRMFTHPALHADPVHPYEAQATAGDLVLNDLGQRLTSMVPTADWLLLSTSSKGGSTYPEGKLDFLTPEQRAEYGAVYRLRMPGNLAATITWTEAPTTLRFVARDGRMTITQDGREIAAAAIDPALLQGLPATRVRYGDGVFGPLRGTVAQTGGQ